MFSQLVRQRRKELGLSLFDLAIEAGVTPQLINYIEHEKHSTTLKKAAKIAKALGFDDMPISKLVND